MVVPGRAAEERQASTATSRSPVSTTTSRSGIAPPGARNCKRSKGAQKMLPSVLPTETDHVPVLADEVLGRPRPAAGRDGRSTAPSAPAATRRCSPAGLRGEGKLIAIDRDPTVEPVLRAPRAAAPPRRRACCTASSRRRARASSPTNGVQADAILLDLGVSSMQLDRPERGFSYAADAPLDMRMDPSRDLDARASRQRDRRAGARATSSAATARSATRARSPARSAARRKRAVRAHGRSRRDDQAGDPRAGALRRRPSGEARLPGSADRRQRRARFARARRFRPRSRCFGPHGRLAVISFHSLEDRIVKRFLRDARARLHLPARLPGLRVRRQPELRAIAAPARSGLGQAEIASNPRSQSARLRVAVKVV